MKSSPIAVPISSSDRRSLELEHLAYSRTGLALDVVVDPTGERWSIHFDDVASVLVRGWDSAGDSLRKLSGDGAIFEIEDDEEFYAFCGVTARAKRYRHFAVSCYDEVLEVLAARISFRQQSA